MTQTRMSERRTTFLGAFLTTLGPISMAIYTPAMPELVRAFGTTDAAIKLSLSMFFAGFALAQLVAGPLADALGLAVERQHLAFLLDRGEAHALGDGAHQLVEQVDHLRAVALQFLDHRLARLHPASLGAPRSAPVLAAALAIVLG